MMNQNPKRVWGGLLPTKKENQKFSFGAVFGYIDPKLLPEEYRVGTPLEIKNQGATFVCVAFSLCSVSEFQEGVILNPAFTIKTISELTGSNQWVYGGTSLDIGAKSALRGALEASESPYSVSKDDLGVLSTPANWNVAYNEIAMKHAKSAHFWIGTSGGSMWDKIRSALYTFKDEHRAIQTGILWNAGWENETYIEKETTPMGGHAIAIIGWIGDWLIIQNSIGKEVGKEGLQFIHRKLVDKLFTFGCLMFADMPSDLTPDQIKEKSKIYRANFFQKLILILIKWWNDILK